MAEETAPVVVQEEAKQETAPAEEPKAETAPAPPVEEKKVEEKKPEEKKPEAVSGKLLAIQKAERELAAKHAKLKEVEAKLAEFENVKRLVKANPDKALEVLGISYEDLARVRIAASTNPEYQGLRAELEEMKEATARAKREAEEAQAKQQAAAYEKWQKDTIAQASDPKQYPMIAHFDVGHVVVQVIDEHWRRTKEIMPVAEAAAKVEKYYAEKVAGLKPKEPEKPKEAPKKEVPAATLSADLRPGASAGAVSEQEAFERAKRALASLGF